jgi:serine/threonine protein kinase/ketosteroid isomerase-like protein
MNEETIFAEARHKPTPAERDEFLKQACGEDPALRARIEALLVADQAHDSLLDEPLVPQGETVEFASTIEKPGDQVGDYKLLQQIGEGGFGVVFMAEQVRPVVRRVALKIIKPGMDSREVIARFEAERQALAMMDHPNIAKVLGAGTTGRGRPYFVMELVRGIPITRFCDDRQLTPKERLELFIPVCHAIQHAHQKGVIHRDIKPSNILVSLYDGRPVPKVIDFGVAKAIQQRLTEKTMFTQFGQVIGTLEYMSPEQAELNQLDVDTRADVYSLGAVLYELLTGSPPFEGKRLRSAAFDQVLRIIREEEPPRPSLRLSASENLPTISAQRKMEPARLPRLVRGELDWMVMKALDKQRERRYESASRFAVDIEAYLSGLPVSAVAPSASYRIRKYVRRHKAAIAVAATILVLLVAGVIVSSVLALQEVRLRANTRVISGFLDAMNARDVDAICDCYDADASWILSTTEVGASEAVIDGKEQIRAKLQSAFDDTVTERLTPQNTTIQVAGDVVIVRGTRLLVEGIKSGKKARASVVHEFLLRDGRIIRQTTLYDTLTWASLFDSESDSQEVSGHTAP